MSRYIFGFGLYRVFLEKNSVYIFYRLPFKTEVLIPFCKIIAVSQTQILPHKVRLTKIFTSAKTFWLPFAPENLSDELFDILKRGSQI